MRAEAWLLGWGALAFGCGDVTAGVSAEREAPRVLTLLHTSDLHSRIWPFRARISSFEAGLGLGEAASLAEVGGVARLATLLGRERQRGAALWLDSGDALEGAPVFERYGGRLELDALGSLGLSAMALGNHELSLASPALAELLTSAAFPVLSANLQPLAGSPLAGWLGPSVVLDAGGLRLGVIGVANQQSPPGLSEPNNDWQLAAAPELAGAVQLALDDLAPRADLVVVLSHLGLDADHALVQGTSGIAAVLGGHQHVLTVEPEWQDDCVAAAVSEARGCSPRRVPIVHSGAYGQWLSRVELELAPDPRQSGGLSVLSAAHTLLPVNDSVPESPQIAAYLTEREAPPEAPLAFLATPLPRRSPLGGDSALGDLTTDAVLGASGADVVLLNSSGLREDVEAGVLLRSDLELAFPFAEPWRLARLRGDVLRRGLLSAARRSAERDCEAGLQVAGLRLKIDCGACEQRSAACLRVERDTPLGRSALADDEWLLVALPDYLTQAGADFEEAASGAELDIPVPEALRRWVAALPVSSEPERCLAALESRCVEAFGAVACPLDAERAWDFCAELPLVEGSRDGRVEMLP